MLFRMGLGYFLQVVLWRLVQTQFRSVSKLRLLQATELLLQLAMLTGLSFYDQCSVHAKAAAGRFLSFLYARIAASGRYSAA
jgi:hypothetical protein